MKEIYLEAYKIRKVEQSLLDLFGQGVVAGTIHTCVGQEFTGIALAQHLREGDVVVSNHRCHGHYMAIFKDYEGLVAEILGKPHGVNRGFGGSQHIHREGFYSSGIQGGMVPSAAGMALSHRLRQSGNIVASYIGDGTLGQGIVYETLNLISVQGVPHLIVVENNMYAQSTHQSETLAGTVEGRAKAFGVDYFQGTTASPEDLIKTVGEAVSSVREKMRPALVEVKTYRLNPHSKGDELREARELEDARRRDPLNRFLEERGDELREEMAAFDRHVAEIIEKAIAADDAIRLGDGPDNRVAADEKACGGDDERTTLVKEINRAFHAIFDADPDAVFLGEDIKDPYGGAFKATQGLHDKHPLRVRNMPISEPAIVGFALGLAMAGRLTFAEIMFGDFAGLAFDQIVNHAAKINAMFGTPVRVPLVIRTPMGGGRGYGATHSQCIEKHFIGVPGLDLYVFHPRVNAARFYQRLTDSIERPAFVAEHKLLYSQDPHTPPPEGYRQYESDEAFPYTHLKPDQAPDVTVVAFGGTGVMLERALPEISEEEVCLDIFYPLDIHSGSVVRAIADSVKQTGKLLLVDEGTPGGSLSDYLHSEVAQVLSPSTRFTTRMVASRPMPIASSRYLEDQILPQGHDIEDAIWMLFDE